MQDYAASSVASVVATAFGVTLFGIIRLKSSGARVGRASNEWSSHAEIKVDTDQLFINWLCDEWAVSSTHGAATVSPASTASTMRSAL
jgi:hypothetical protein